MKVQCPNCGKSVMVNGLGRKRRELPVQNILDAYRRYPSVRAVARKLDLPPGTVWNCLKNEGVLKSR